MSKPETMMIDGVKYVRADSIQNTPAQKLDGLEYVIVRTYTAGVFAGYLESREGQEVVLLKVRRLWYWEGAASLSQLSVDGVSKPEKCQFPCEVDKVTLLQAIEILPVTAKAKASIDGVAIWRK
jgi:hypothetical protein